MVRFVSQSRVQNNRNLTPEQKEVLKERLYKRYVERLGLGIFRRELPSQKGIREFSTGVKDPYFIITSPLPIPCLANYHEGVQKRLLAVRVDQTGMITSYDKSNHEDLLHYLDTAVQKGVINEQERDRIVNALSNFVLDLNIRSAYIVADMAIIRHEEKDKICILKYTLYKDDNHFLFNDEECDDFQGYKNPNKGYMVISLSKERDEDAVAIANFYNRVGANVSVSLVEQRRGKPKRGLKSKRELIKENEQLVKENKELRSRVESLERILDTEEGAEEREKEVSRLEGEIKRMKDELEWITQELSKTRQRMYEKEHVNNRLLDTIYRVQSILRLADFGSRKKAIKEALEEIESVVSEFREGKE